ncbi:MAG: GDSL-type esterase/lipase family protein [Opitutales bacterium]|nr:GDSL-type esterase/lipase family protein [Opitutales bacterium]
MKPTLLIILAICFSSTLSAKERVQVVDYAKIERYQEANEALPELRRGEKRVVFMGDSITAAWVKKRPEFFTDNNFVGRGISGQVTHQMLLRFRSDVIDLQPQVVVILAGTNDIAQNSGPVTLEAVAANIKSMAELAQQNGIQPILCSVLPAKDYPWRAGKDPLSNIPKLNALIEAYALQNNIPYIDYFSAMEDGHGGMKVPEHTAATDLVHPNTNGYAEMEAMLKPVIDAALER